MKSETIPIIYEDSEIVLISKRQGLAVQGGSGISHSVDSDLAAQVGQKIYLVHRLDKETSGLLLCAKSPAAAAKWTRLVGEKSVVKEYKALCFGAAKNPSGRICRAIAERGVKKRAETFYETEKVFEIPCENLGVDICGERNRVSFADGNSAKENREKSAAENPNETCGEFHEEKFVVNPPKSFEAFPKKVSLFRLRLGTGRTHQLRIHLAGEGFPICGDDKYGDFAANRLLKKNFGIKRLCLCAFRLTLPLAGGQKTFEIEAEFLKTIKLGNK